jgi:hypothetical protein
MSTDSRPSFILLESPLPAEKCGDKLLGRVVTDMKNPTHDYKPETPSEYLKSYCLEIVDADWNSFAERNSAVRGALAFGKIVGLSGNASSNEADERKGAFVRTRTLTQHTDTKKTLMASEHAEDVLTLLEENESIGYLAVGYKSILNGSHEMTFRRNTTFTIRAALPVAEATQGVTEGVIRLPADAIDPSANLEVVNSSINRSAASAVGEQIFAVQYRRLELTSTWYGRKKKEAEIGPVERVKFPAAVFGPDDRRTENPGDEGLSNLPEDDDGIIMDERVFSGDDVPEGSQLITLV